MRKHKDGLCEGYTRVRTQSNLHVRMSLMVKLGTSTELSAVRLLLVPECFLLAHSSCLYDSLQTKMSRDSSCQAHRPTTFLSLFESFMRIHVQLLLKALAGEGGLHLKQAPSSAFISMGFQCIGHHWPDGRTCFPNGNFP